MKIRGTNWNLVFHRSLLREPIDAVRSALGQNVPQRNRTWGEALTPVSVRPRVARLPDNDNAANAAPSLPALRPLTPLEELVPAGLILAQPASDDGNSPSASLRQFETDFTESSTSGSSSDLSSDATISCDVLDVRQTRINACGDACLNMMLAFHGMPHETSGSNERRTFEGLLDGRLANTLETNGLQVTFLGPANDGNITLNELRLWLRTYGPLICGSDDHYFVVTGLRQNDVTIQCPLLGRRQGSISALNRYIDWSQTQPPILATTRAPADPPSEDVVAESSTSAQRPSAAQRAATRLLALIEKTSTPDWKKPK